MSENLSAIILTGGSSSRFGSNKSLAMLEGKTLLSHLLTDLAANIEVVIVGPTFESQLRSLKFVQEDPVGGGPVAAVDAGLALIDTEFVALIATDMPFAASVIHDLANSLEPSIDGIVPLDREGMPQTLCAIYRTDALKQAIARLGSPQGHSMRSLTALLQLKEIEIPASLQSRLLDIDTPEELQQAITEREAGTMNEWIEEVKKELGLTLNIDIDSILDTARDAAHTIERKAAPVTTFLLGYAVATGADFEDATKKIAELAKNWPSNK